MASLFHASRGNCSDLPIVDSTLLVVCSSLRIRRHKVFAGLATMGKRSTGWIFGFELHAIIHHLGELLAIRLTPGKVDDWKPLTKVTLTFCLETKATGPNL